MVQRKSFWLLFCHTT